MKIFKQIKSSIYDKEYYKNTVLNETFKESLKYLAKLSLVVALFGVIIFSFSIPTISKAIKNGVSSFVSDYPDDLVVSIKDGNATINKPEPYTVKMPAGFIDSSDSKSLKINNLITINTTEPFNLDKFRSYSTITLLTKNDLILMQTERGQVKILPLSDMGNIEITKTLVLEKEIYINKILPWVMKAMVPLGYIVIFIGVFTSSLIILFFYAVFVWALLKIKGMKLSYIRSYQVALHASTALLIYGAFSMFLGPLDNVVTRILILAVIIYLNFDNNSNPIVEEEKVIEVESKEKIDTV